MTLSELREAIIAKHRDAKEEERAAFDSGREMDGVWWQGFWAGLDAVLDRLSEVKS